jgi:hypothetical protein
MSMSVNEKQTLNIPEIEKGENSHERRRKYKHMRKIKLGKIARKKWKKPINFGINKKISIEELNKLELNKFEKRANIITDDNPNKRTLLKAVPSNPSTWKQINEHIYVLTRNDVVVKIGGTRNGLHKRWNSYLTGFCVPERKKTNGDYYPGKMSVTNAYLVHTMEHDLLNHNSVWEIWSWALPAISTSIKIFGDDKTHTIQTFHIYENEYFDKFKDISGGMPILCGHRKKRTT